MRHLIVVAALGMALPALAQEQVYVRGQVGWGFLGSVDAGGAGGAFKNDQDGNPIPFGAAVGWNVGDGFRVEGAFEIGNMNLQVPAVVAPVTASEAKVDSWNVMLNGIYDIDVGGDQPFYPYVGVGVGWANTSLSSSVTTTEANTATTVTTTGDGAGFAFNVLAGAAYEFSDQASVYVEAKYFSKLGSDIDLTTTGVTDTVQATGVTQTNAAIYLGVMFGF